MQWGLVNTFSRAGVMEVAFGGGSIIRAMTQTRMTVAALLCHL